MANAFGGSPNSSLENMLRMGAARADAGVGAASNGLSAVLAGGGQIRSDTNSMRGQAQLVNTQAGSVNMTANELAALATTLAPCDAVPTMLAYFARYPVVTLGGSGFHSALRFSSSSSLTRRLI